jgi:hypothetical protein
LSSDIFTVQRLLPPADRPKSLPRASRADTLDVLMSLTAATKVKEA